MYKNIYPYMIFIDYNELLENIGKNVKKMAKIIVIFTFLVIICFYF